MDLATHQRTLLGLLRASHRVRDDDEPYVQQLARSRDLQEARGNEHNISPFREFQAPAFLASLDGHGDPLVVAVACFERALMSVREGDAQSHAVRWPCEPAVVLQALATQSPLPDDLPRADHITRISRDLPRLFEIERVGQGA
ncbi:MAG: hypothetical protein HY021_10035 [Burkholderiales bacterium]|nr:hypothetical protein [Burkholderiales bacterium]